MGRDKDNDLAPPGPWQGAIDCTYHNGLMVPLRIHGWSENILAKVDTGAAYSVAGGAIGQHIRQVGDEGPEMTLRWGDHRITGPMVRVEVTLPDNTRDGEDMDFEMTFLVSETWPREPFMGYQLAMEYLRLALLPMSQHHTNARMFFGYGAS